MMMPETARLRYIDAVIPQAATKLPHVLLKLISLGDLLFAEPNSRSPRRKNEILAK